VQESISIDYFIYKTKGEAALPPSPEELGFPAVNDEEERSGRPLPLDSLLILSRLRQERRLSTMDLTHSTQKSEQETRVTLEKLVESGLIEAHGTGRGRTYTLSAKLYQKSGQKADYVRQAGFNPIQQEQMIMSYIKENKTIKRSEAADLCRISPFQSYRILKKLMEEGVIIPKGKGKGTTYERRCLQHAPEEAPSRFSNISTSCDIYFTNYPNKLINIKKTNYNYTKLTVNYI